MLQANPDVNAIFCGNDAMAMGAYQAVLAAGKSGVIQIYGFDGADDVIDAIREGKIKATGMQFPKTMAKTAADFANEFIKKSKKDFPQKVPVAVELVNADNAGDYGSYEKAAK